MMMRYLEFEEYPLKKGVWSSKEDQKLVSYINQYGIWNWNEMPKAAGLRRTGKSCRLRWMNYLRPDLKHGNFSEEEDEIILTLHQTLGNRWSAIAANLSGRTDNEIKNQWHSHLKKRLNNNDNNNSFQVQQMTDQKETKSDPENFVSHNFTILDSSSNSEDSYMHNSNSDSSSGEEEEYDMKNLMVNDDDEQISVNFSAEFYEMLDNFIQDQQNQAIDNYMDDDDDDDDEMWIDDDDDDDDEDESISNSSSGYNSSNNSSYDEYMNLLYSSPDDHYYNWETNAQFMLC